MKRGRVLVCPISLILSALLFLSRTPHVQFAKEFLIRLVTMVTFAGATLRVFQNALRSLPDHRNFSRTLADEGSCLSNCSRNYLQNPEIAPVFWICFGSTTSPDLLVGTLPWLAD